MGTAGRTPEPLTAERAQYLFQRSTEAYQAKRYEAAAQDLEAVLEGGFESAAVHYNLGNAWFRLGKPGRAILHYRRAERLAPRDEDLRVNLALAREATVDRLRPAEAPSWRRALLWVRDRLSLAELAAFFLGAMGLLAALLLARAVLPARGSLRMAIRGAAGLTLALGLCLGARTWMDRPGREGVVVAAESAARTGPGEEFAVHFRLHEGAEFSVLERRPGWTKIEVQDRRGWLSDADVEGI
jgi:tetratricopeptide (TPR) repeat protein